ncbi:hypothetical protein [Protaetiibacter mangrovi]|uniref:Zinc ribbon domain-containing protein n=1 Tax=Protaetiibacter mangrovi TaxID=2970926 RepID=A0ABT1ZEY9_9MICO|nr:hypothetical protein [Protaetiibacter mangrovi]MCS0499277.1 hypothetical protein [Protaetiibacter mangrovi]
MTVAAPTTRLPFGTTVERARRGIACASCRAPSLEGEPFCAHCGARVVIPATGRPAADVAATRSLQFAGLVVLANAVVGGLAFAVVYLVSDAARLTEAAIFLQGLQLLVVAALATTSIRFGVRGLRDTADGMLRRRGWAVAGIVVSSTIALLVTLSFALVLVLAIR